MTTVIREAQQSDCTELAQVHVASWRAGYVGLIDQDHLDKLSVEERAKRWSEVVAGDRDTVYLQFDSESLIGFA